jgi:hypothetical protein
MPTDMGQGDSHNALDHVSHVFVGLAVGLVSYAVLLVLLFSSP